MATDSEVVDRHIAALLAEAESEKIPSDVIGRILIQAAIGIWQKQRDWNDVASELRYMADNLDPDLDYEFMRP